MRNKFYLCVFYDVKTPRWVHFDAVDVQILVVMTKNQWKLKIKRTHKLAKGLRDLFYVKCTCLYYTIYSETSGTSSLSLAIYSKNKCFKTTLAMSKSGLEDLFYIKRIISEGFTHLRFMQSLTGFRLGNLCIGFLKITWYITRY